MRLKVPIDSLAARDVCVVVEKITIANARQGKGCGVKRPVQRANASPELRVIIEHFAEAFCPTFPCCTYGMADIAFCNARVSEFGCDGTTMEI